MERRKVGRMLLGLVCVLSAGAASAFAAENAATGSDQDDQSEQPVSEVTGETPLRQEAPPEPVVTTATPSTRTRSSTPARASRPTTATATENAKLEQKLNDILQHQQDILTRLDQVMEELRIVKIRATIR